MKTLMIAIVMLMSTAAFAGTHCWEEGGGDTTVCQLSDGRVNVTSMYENGEYFSDDYSSLDLYERVKHSVSDCLRFANSRTKWVSCEKAHGFDENGAKVYVGKQREAAAQSDHTQASCVDDQFIWKDNACHASK